MSEKQKKKYYVYAVLIRCFDEKKSEQKYFIGDTFAVSEKKAINNVRFRIGEKHNFYHDDDPAETGDWREIRYVAEENKVNKELGK